MCRGSCLARPREQRREDVGVEPRSSWERGGRTAFIGDDEVGEEDGDGDDDDDDDD